MPGLNLVPFSLPTPEGGWGLADCSLWVKSSLTPIFVEMVGKKLKEECFMTGESDNGMHILVSINQVLMEHSLPGFVCVLSVAALQLEGQG